MRDVQRSRRRRGNTRHLAQTNRDEKRRVHKLNRRNAKRHPNSTDVPLNNRNIS